VTINYDKIIYPDGISDGTIISMIPNTFGSGMDGIYLVDPNHTNLMSMIGT
jgi:hypothetical protein